MSTNEKRIEGLTDEQLFKLIKENVDVLYTLLVEAGPTSFSLNMSEVDMNYLIYLLLSNNM